MKRIDIVRSALVAGGFFYLLTGIGLLFTPQWFFDNIGFYPPYNRHYAGDLGAFTIPMAIAILYAARQPARHRLMIAFAFAGSLVHAFNHLVDDPIINTLPLFAFAALFWVAWYLCPTEGTTETARSSAQRV